MTPRKLRVLINGTPKPVEKQGTIASLRELAAKTRR